MTHQDWVNYREGLRSWLTFDRSMPDITVHRITCEIEMVNDILNAPMMTKEPMTTGQIKEYLKTKRKTK